MSIEDFTKPVGIDLSNANLSDFNLGDIASGFSGDIGNLGITPDFLSELNANPDLLRAFQAEFPDDFNAIKDIINVGNLETDDAVVTDKNQIVSTSGDVKESMDSPNRGGATDVTKTTDKTKDKKGILGTDITAGDAAKYAAMLAIAKMAYDDAQRAREAAKGWSPKSSPTVTAHRSGKTDGVTYRRYAASGGLMDLFKGDIREREDILDSNNPFATVRNGYDTPYAIDELNAFKAFASGLGIDPYSFIKQTRGAPEYNVPTSLTGLYDPLRGSFGSTYGKTARELEQAMRAEGRKRSEQYHKSVADEARARQVAEDQKRQDAYLASRSREDVPLASSGAAYEAERARSLANLQTQQAAARDTSNPLNVFGVNEFDPATNQIITRSETTEELLRRGIDPTGSTAQRRALPWTGAMGGVAALAQGRYLDGHSDGMADKVPAHIDNKRPAALSDGEFVIPADVVSHLGNGNSNAGAKRLYEMMDRIRAARTGNPKQGKQINPDKFMPR